jgi:hypothetical protein
MDLRSLAGVEGEAAAVVVEVAADIVAEAAVVGTEVEEATADLRTRATEAFGIPGHERQLRPIHGLRIHPTRDLRVLLTPGPVHRAMADRRHDLRLPLIDRQAVRFPGARTAGRLNYRQTPVRCSTAERSAGLAAEPRGPSPARAGVERSAFKDPVAGPQAQSEVRAEEEPQESWGREAERPAQSEVQVAEARLGSLVREAARQRRFEDRAARGLQESADHTVVALPAQSGDRAATASSEERDPTETDS